MRPRPGVHHPQTSHVDVGAAPRDGRLRARALDRSRRSGWYPGDHHIHAAGCAPLRDARPRASSREDMMRHILGEDLNVGCVLTLGARAGTPRSSSSTAKRSTALDARLPDALRRRGLRLPVDPRRAPLPAAAEGRDYPGTTAIEEWPSWDLPVLKWGKAQGGVVGFSHSGWGLQVKADTSCRTTRCRRSTASAPTSTSSTSRTTRSTSSRPSTRRPLWELNIWYHTLNCGFRTRISGETDFPCIYGERVGLGRSYVQARRRQARLRPLVRGDQRGPLLRQRRQEPPDRLPRQRS